MLAGCWQGVGRVVFARRCFARQCIVFARQSVVFARQCTVFARQSVVFAKAVCTDIQYSQGGDFFEHFWEMEDRIRTNPIILKVEFLQDVEILQRQGKMGYTRYSIMINLGMGNIERSRFKWRGWIREGF